MRIDLNCDLGEGCPHDAKLMPLITSANVACGFHAGDAVTARETLRLAVEHGVQVGAHPGFADRGHFGRRELDVSESQVYSECVYQIGALIGLAQSVGATVRYVKAHGALYNLAFRKEAFARPIVSAACLFGLVLLGQPGSKLQELSRRNCRFVAEGFADRRYQADGSLVLRTKPNAFVEDPAEAVRQAKSLIDERGVQTLCVHGDNPKAVEFVRALRDALTAEGFVIAPWK